MIMTVSSHALKRAKAGGVPPTAEAGGLPALKGKQSRFAISLVAASFPSSRGINSSNANAPAEANSFGQRVCFSSSDALYALLFARLPTEEQAQQ